MSSVPVSIVIPSYHGSKFMNLLILCLQPYYDKGYEIILVEDGSNDGTKEMFLGAFPNAIYAWQENSGPAKARLTGVKMATGDFIQLLDVDDTIEPDKLEHQYKYAIDHQLDVVYSDWRYALKKEGVDHIQYSHWITEDICEDVILGVFRKWWFPPASMIVSRDAFLAIDGGDMSLKVTEDDVDLYLRLASRGYSFGYCKGKFTNHFKYENNISRSGRRSEGYWRDVAVVIMNTLSFLKEEGTLSSEQREAGLDKLFITMRNMAKTNLKKAAAYWAFIKSLDEGYTPKNQSTLFMTFYRWLGYKNAERLALLLAVFSAQKKYHSVQNDHVYKKTIPSK